VHPEAERFSASGGLCPLTRGSAPGPWWGLCPQTPFIGLLSPCPGLKPPKHDTLALPLDGGPDPPGEEAILGASPDPL